jgi:acyl carrier protein
MTRFVDIEERIQTILHQRLQVEAPASDEDLFQAGILDSLSFVDMLVALEDEFSIQIPLDQVDLNDFRSISKIGDYIVSQNRRSTNGVPLGRHSTV